MNAHQNRNQRITGVRSRWVVGVDLGQRQDHSAVAALEVRDVVYDERDAISMDFARERQYRLRGIERVRLDTPYPDVVRHLRDIVKLPALLEHSTLVMDATGVGAPVVDLMKAERPGCRIVPVMITGGDHEASDGSGYRVPKRLQAVLEQQRLRIATSSRSARDLVTELSAMRTWVSGFGRERFEPDRARIHDDLVMAVALAWWWVRRQGPGVWGLK